MATPSSVKAMGTAPPSFPRVGITVCDTRISVSLAVSSNMKSAGKTAEISSHCLLQRSCFHAIKLSQIEIENNILIAQEKNPSLDLSQDWR
jgi:hypothetical protein